MITTRGKVYRITLKQSDYMKPSNKIIYIWNYGKKLDMAPRGWQANKFQIVRKNGRKCLLMYEGPALFLITNINIKTKIASLL